jgi:hypothetical protein
MVFEAVEPGFPCGGLVADPGLHSGQSLRFEAAGSHSALFFGSDKAACFERLEMLEHGGQADRQRCGELGYGSGAAAQGGQHSTANRVGERLEGTV